jgi:hypothetical protein
LFLDVVGFGVFGLVVSMDEKSKSRRVCKPGGLVKGDLTLNLRQPSSEVTGDGTLGAIGARVIARDGLIVQ